MNPNQATPPPYNPSRGTDAPRRDEYGHTRQDYSRENYPPQDYPGGQGYAGQGYPFRPDFNRGPGGFPPYDGRPPYSYSPPRSDQYGGYMQPPARNNGFAIAGFILAVLSVFIGWFPLLGWVIWLLGAVFSFIGLFRQPRGLAVAGVIISMVVIPVIGTVLVGLDMFTTALFGI